MTEHEWKYLEPHPQSSYKQLFLKGTRIRAESIYAQVADGDPPPTTTPEEIAEYMNLPVEGGARGHRLLRGGPAGSARRSSPGEGTSASPRRDGRRGQLPSRHSSATVPGAARREMKLYLDDDSIAPGRIRIGG